MVDFAVLVAGSGPDERPEDVVYLCEQMAFRLYRAGRGSGAGDSARYNAALIDVGKILCLIFDMVKPPTYQMEMRKVRRDYRGIADDVHLQRIYAQRVETALADGALDDVRAAVEHWLPAVLAAPIDELAPAW